MSRAALALCVACGRGCDVYYCDRCALANAHTRAAGDGAGDADRAPTASRLGRAAQRRLGDATAWEQYVACCSIPDADVASADGRFRSGEVEMRRVRNRMDAVGRGSGCLAAAVEPGLVMHWTSGGGSVLRPAKRMSARDRERFRRFVLDCVERAYLHDPHPDENATTRRNRREPRRSV